MKKIMFALAVIGALLVLAACEPPVEPVEKYDLAYSVNGGTGTVAATAEYAEGSSVTLAAGTGLSKTGLRFVGWNSKEDGTGTSYAAGATFTTGSADATLYAKWEDPIIGTWSSSYDLAGTYVNVTDVTTITATTFSTARTLKWTATAPAVLAALGADAAAQTALGITVGSVVK